MRNNYFLGSLTLAFVLSLVLSLSCGCSKLSQQSNSSSTTPTSTANANSQQGIAVNLPRDMNNAMPDPLITRESSGVITIPNNDEFYIGESRSSIDKLGDKISEMLKGKFPEEKIVYIKGGVSVEYKSIVDVIRVIRKQEVDRIGLVVGIKTSPHLSRFEILVPPEPDLKDPLTLVVTVGSDEKLKLNYEDMGVVSDMSALSARLVNLFKQREIDKGYRVGTNQVEKKVFVKASRAMQYGKVVKVIDALKGAGADPIGLQIDDLQ